VPVPVVGTQLGSYRLEALLGRGGMGVVYRAFDVRLGRHVALKLLAGHLAQDARSRTRFLTESRLAASIDHAGIVPIYKAGEIDGHLFIAMRYVRGTDLASRLRENGPLAPSGRSPWSANSRRRSMPRTRVGRCTATSSRATRWSRWRARPSDAMRD
jgi:serine/threonine protein kinase